MKWENILKDNRTRVIALLEEGILPGYSIRFEDNFPYRAFVVVSKFPELINNKFYFADLHLNLSNTYMPKFELIELWRPLAPAFKAAIVGLDLFLQEVNRDNNFDKIDRHNQYMKLSSDILKFSFALGRSCDSTIMDPDEDNKARMCLDFASSSEKPALGDSWLSIYMLAKILVNSPLSAIREMVRRNTIPQVLEGAMGAILTDDYSIKCDFCESFTVDENQCDECGYFLDVDEDGDITVHEGVEPWKTAYPTGWECPHEHPNNDDFIFYSSFCQRHGVAAGDYGPAHGFDYLGEQLGQMDAYLWNGNIVPEGSEDLIPIADTLAHYSAEDAIYDLVDHYTIEELGEMMNFTSEDLDNGNWKLVIGDTTYIWDGGSLKEYDEEE